jgi:hypothetical protein
MAFLISRQLIQRIAKPNNSTLLYFNKNTTTPFRNVTTHSEQESGPPVSKTKQFMKKYGYVGIGVYLALGAVDLAATMGFISVKGAKYVREVEDYVMGKAKGYLGMEHTPLEAKDLNEKPSLASLFVIAYGIHKTIFLPFRLSLTAAITPTVAKRLAKLGWVQHKFINKK